MDEKVFDEFARLHNEMNRFIEHLRNVSKIPTGFATTTWSPLVNTYERDDAYIVLVELPGVDPQNLRVTVHEKQAILQGEKKAPAVVRNARYQRMEFSFGPFVRTVTFAEPVHADGVEANFKHGRLELVLPKRGATRSRKEIPIKSVD